MFISKSFKELFFNGFLLESGCKGRAFFNTHQTFTSFFLNFFSPFFNPIDSQSIKTTKIRTLIFLPLSLLYLIIYTRARKKKFKYLLALLSPPFNYLPFSKEWVAGVLTLSLHSCHPLKNTPRRKKIMRPHILKTPRDLIQNV